MPERLKVGIVGATGETGLSICNDLLSAPTEFVRPELTSSGSRRLIDSQEVFAFARSASLQKPALLALAEQGVTLSSIDLDGPSSDVAELLNGMTAVISCLTAKQYTQELNLISAAKEAGVQRYVPSFFGPVVPPRGVLDLRSAVSMPVSRKCCTELTQPPERRVLRPHQKASCSIHCYRHWLVVPDGHSPFASRKQFNCFCTAYAGHW